MRIQLPKNVTNIIRVLTEAGYEAYAVGGCVRDSILGREPDDWDITTSARPDQVKALFRRTIDTGIRHGTVTVMIESEGYEVTTYRIDGEYEDSRHPKEVEFTASLEEDLKRRDFTMNAMAYNDTQGLVDIFGGIQDMKAGIIRAVGNPQERFEEDALRIMRAVRFAAQLGCRIEGQTETAARRLAPSLAHISAERIRTELVKLLISEHPEHMRILYDTGITGIILPEFDAMMDTGQHNRHHCFSVGEHTLQALKQVPPDKCLRLAVLLHDVGKPLTKSTDEAGEDHFRGHAKLGRDIAGRILHRLKFDNDTTGKVKEIIYWHDYRPNLTQVSVRRGISKIGKDIFPCLFPVQRADILAQSTYMREEKLSALARMKELYEEIITGGQCLTLKELAVTGGDLQSLGMKPGPALGETLAALLDWVLEHPEDNRRETLLKHPIIIGRLP